MARNLRIVTGIILFAFVTMHLVNMSIGLVSLKALDDARWYFMLPWSNPVGSIVLIGSMLIHGALGLVALYWRNTLQMTRHDLIQMVSALLIVPLLASHVLGVTLAAEMFQVEPTYTFVLTVFWVQAPLEGLRQILVVAVTWIHGCLGLMIWLRLKSWWPTAAVLAYPLAVLVPILAMLGFVEAGNEIVAMNAGAVAAPAPTEAEAAALATAFEQYNRIKWTVIGVYLAIVAAVFVARQMRLASSRTGVLTLRYLTGDTIRTEGGVTLLEAAQVNDLPHASICRGRGRCGTCRVRIISSTAELPEPSENERRVLERFDSPPSVRLACQLVSSSGTIELERMLPPDADLDALVPPSQIPAEQRQQLSETAS